MTRDDFPVEVRSVEHDDWRVTRERSSEDAPTEREPSTAIFLLFNASPGMVGKRETIYIRERKG